MSAEGTTQGDPFQLTTVQPSIAELQTSSSAKQCWFAGSGTQENVMRWLDKLGWTNLRADLP